MVLGIGQSTMKAAKTGMPREQRWRNVKTVASLVWPTGQIALQLRLLLCGVIVVVGRVINFYTPIYHKKIVDSIAVESGVYRWDLVVVYAGLKFLQRGSTGGIGLLNNARGHMWTHIQQYISLKTESKLFRHIHGLSLRWHVGRDTGKALTVMDRGTDSINKLLDTALFSIVPTILDIFVAVIFFVGALSKWLGLILFLTIILYVVVTICVTKWCAKFQESKTLADDARKARCNDSFLNYETVKYYGGESIEVDSYKEAILKYHKEDWKSLYAFHLLNFSRNLILTFGLLAGSLLCLHMVVYGRNLTTGDYVLFTTCIIQLYVPLNSFGTYYRDIQKNLQNMESMINLLRETQDVTNAPDAQPLIVNRGHVEFSNVSFSYTPEKPVLKNVSFVVPAGKTLALVGPSGAGKSTIIRLLFRLYDVNSGKIFIDEQDIRNVDQDSLRKSIGVVPQDTVLFNNTIKYNIQYGRLGASEKEINAAAKHADIHDRILGFPEGYETQVGERGLRLSGGEKQRVAIARTILKAPKIVLLDEATSALDTQTEQNIQAALNRVCADRTTIVVSHRLSTIIHADEILVLKSGEIVESGSHDDLIARKRGIYYDMWTAQRRRPESEEMIDETNSLTNCKLSSSAFF